MLHMTYPGLTPPDVYKDDPGLPITMLNYYDPSFALVLGTHLMGATLCIDFRPLVPPYICLGNKYLYLYLYLS